MSALRHLLRRSSGAMALALAFAVVLGSVCPRGWFLCVHDDVLALVDGHHANGADQGADEAGCDADHGCPGGCPEDGDAPDGTGCLDLALSLVLDDQANSVLVWGTLPRGALIARLPDPTAAAALRRCAAVRGLAGGPPPSPFVTHIRLQV